MHGAARMRQREFAPTPSEPPLHASRYFPPCASHAPWMHEPDAHHPPRRSIASEPRRHCRLSPCATLCIAHHRCLSACVSRTAETPGSSSSPASGGMGHESAKELAPGRLHRPRLSPPGREDEGPRAVRRSPRKSRRHRRAGPQGGRRADRQGSGPHRRAYQQRRDHAPRRTPHGAPPRPATLPRRPASGTPPRLRCCAGAR